MSSIDIKEQLVDGYYKKTNIKDWKRLSKKSIGTFKIIVRLFENKKIDTKVLVIGDEEIEAVHEIDDMYFCVIPADEDTKDFAGDEVQSMICFSQKKFWNQNHFIPDQHLQFLIESQYNVPGNDWLDEICENQFVCNDDVETVKSVLTNLGMEFNPEMGEMLEVN